MRKILALKLIYVLKNLIFSNSFIASKSNLVLYNHIRPHFTKKGAPYGSRQPEQIHGSVRGWADLFRALEVLSTGQC